MTPCSRFGTLAAAGATVLLVSACGATPAHERMDYLRTVAVRGADTHALLKSQKAKIDRGRCEAAYDALKDDRVPPDSSSPFGGMATNAWLDQVKLFFVDSCVSGVPKAVNDTRRTTSPPATTTADAR